MRSGPPVLPLPEASEDAGEALLAAGSPFLAVLVSFSVRGLLLINMMGKSKVEMKEFYACAVQDRCN